MSIHEQVTGPTREMEAAIYGALDAIDAYTSRVRHLLADQLASDDPNEMLVKRFNQFLKKADAMTRIMEDEVITELLFCVDRLFAVDLAERGEFI